MSWDFPKIFQPVAGVVQCLGGVCVTLRPCAASCPSGHRQEWSEGGPLLPESGVTGVSGSVRMEMGVEGAWQ